MNAVVQGAQPSCEVCEHPLREACDMLLLEGHGYQTIVHKFALNPTFAEALKWHHYYRHIIPPTREGYVILIVDYVQNIERRLAEELARPLHKQRASILTGLDRSKQWAISETAKAAGLYTTSSKTINSDVIQALNQLVQGDPSALKRIADARAKEVPLLVEATPIEEPAKFEEQVSLEKIAINATQSSSKP